MLKSKMLIPVITAALVLAACGSSDDVTESSGSSESVSTSRETAKAKSEKKSEKTQKEKTGESKSESDQNGTKTNSVKKEETKSTQPSAIQGQSGSQNIIDYEETDAVDPVYEEREKVWVEPVYKEVYHEETGHYETVTYTVKKVQCGPECDLIFDTEEEWKAHQDAYMAGNGGVCDHKHDRPAQIDVQESETVYVVDTPAWTETVTVQEGYWK